MDLLRTHPESERTTQVSPFLRDFVEHGNGSSIRLAQVVQAATGISGQITAFLQAPDHTVDVVIGAVAVSHDEVLDLVREIPEVDAATAAASARLAGIRVFQVDEIAHRSAGDVCSRRGSACIG